MLTDFTQTLGDAITCLMERPHSQLVALIGSRNAAPHLRVAAALVVAGAASDFKNADDVDELAMLISGAEDDARAIRDPFDTDGGRLFVKLGPLPMDEWEDVADGESVLDLIVMNVIARARQPGGFVEKGWSTTLLLATGRDGYWWVDWLRSEASRPASEDLNHE